MIVESLSPALLNECYGLEVDYDLTELPFTIDLENVPNFEATENVNKITPPNIEEVDNYFFQTSYGEVTYSFVFPFNDGKTRLYAEISNFDFWFNDHNNRSVVIFNEHGLFVNKYIEILNQEFIKELFVKNLSKEVERLDNLELFNSFSQLNTLLEKFSEHKSKLWCVEIIGLVEKIKEKIADKFKEINSLKKYRNLIYIIIVNRSDDERKHLNRINALFSKLDLNECLTIYHDLLSLFNAEEDEGNGLLYFYKYDNNGHYSVFMTISVWEFSRILDYFFFTDNNKIFVDSKIIGNKDILQNPTNLTFPLVRKTFTQELLYLVNITAVENDKFILEEVDYIAQTITNTNKFNPNRPEILKFQRWLESKSNIFLFQLFLGFISSETANVIPSGSYDRLAVSIAEKFRCTGLGVRNLRIKYINSKEQLIVSNDNNKSSIAFIKKELTKAQKYLKKGIVKKMINEILNKF